MKKTLAFLALSAALISAAPAMAQSHGDFRHHFNPGFVQVHGWQNGHGWQGGPGWHGGPGWQNPGYRPGPDYRYEYRGHNRGINPLVPFLFGYGVGALTAPRYYGPTYEYYEQPRVIVRPAPRVIVPYDDDYYYEQPRVIVRPAPRGDCGCW